MRTATDAELRAMGWKWALRYEGVLMALTVSAHDAANWMNEGAGDVVNLLHTAPTQEPRP
jgi:hypothetical protein